MFLDSSGKPLPFVTAVLSGRATGVPGAVKMLALAHDEHGKLPWRTLFGDAERAADTGFIVSALALLDHNPRPTEAEVRRWLAGNLCRCTGYDKIVRAVLDAAECMATRPAERSKSAS